MGVARRALATRAATRPSLAWDVPAGWTLAAAASAPVAYCTAYYALVVRGRLTRGQRVLVHSGCGAVGLAAIAIALHRGCEACAHTVFKRLFQISHSRVLYGTHTGALRAGVHDVRLRCEAAGAAGALPRPGARPHRRQPLVRV